MSQRTTRRLNHRGGADLPPSDLKEIWKKDYLPIWKSLEVKGYKTKEIIVFFRDQKSMKIANIRKAAEDMPDKSVKPANNNTKKVKRPSKENIGNVAPPVSNENKASLAKFLKDDTETPKLNIGNVVPPVSTQNKAKLAKLLEDDDTETPKLNIGNVVPPVSTQNKAKLAKLLEDDDDVKSISNTMRASLRKEKGRNKEVSNNFGGPIGLFGNNSEEEEVPATEPEAATKEEEVLATTEEAPATEDKEADKSNGSLTMISTNTHNNNTKSTVSNTESERDNADTNEDRLSAEEFAKQHGIGANFLNLYGIFRLKGNNNTTITNPVGFLLNLPNFTLYNKAEGALYLLLDEFAKRFKQILSSKDSDDKKIIFIISLREMIIRTLIHTITYYGWLCGSGGESDALDPVIEKILSKKDRISPEEVKEFYFDKDQETFEIIEKYIWSTFKNDTIEKVAKDMFNTVTKPTLLLEIIEHHAYSLTLESFIAKEYFILEEDISPDLYKIFSSKREEEVLRFFKDLVQKGAPSAKELRLIDVLYSASISPVRFTRLNELAEFVDKQLGYGDEVDVGSIGTALSA